MNRFHGWIRLKWNASEINEIDLETRSNAADANWWPMTFAYSQCSYTSLFAMHTFAFELRSAYLWSGSQSFRISKILTKIINSGANATQNTNTSIFDRPENKMKTKFATSFICSVRFAPLFSVHTIYKWFEWTSHCCCAAAVCFWCRSSKLKLKQKERISNAHRLMI